MLQLASLAAFCVAAPAYSMPPPNPDPAIAPWFESLRDPETTMPCCAETDCRSVEDRMVAGHFEVLIGGSWVAVPAGKVIRDMSNPTGRAVLCWSAAMGIMCFVPGPGA